tara:strand:+ start:1021 stop:1818 length:798 start_codon:yes stop_codon:yes gene_type:complete
MTIYSKINENFIRTFIKISVLSITLIGLIFTSISVFHGEKLPKENFFNLIMTQHREDVCLEIDSGVECQDEVFKRQATASGLGFKSIDGSTYILTAAHFCAPDMFSEFSYFDDVVSDKVEIDLWAFDINGSAWESEIVFIDIEPDLCLVRSDLPDVREIEVSDSMPEIGERVYSISSPLGISSKGVSLHFDGKFSGCDDRNDICFFTIPATFGSSGSIVLDKNKRAIGMIQMTARGFDSIAMGVGQRQLIEFLEKASKELKIDLI